MAFPEMSGKVAGGFEEFLRIGSDFVTILLAGIRRGPVLRPAGLRARGRDLKY